MSYVQTPMFMPYPAPYAVHPSYVAPPPHASLNQKHHREEEEEDEERRPSSHRLRHELLEERVTEGTTPFVLVIVCAALGTAAYFGIQEYQKVQNKKKDTTSPKEESAEMWSVPSLPGKLRPAQGVSEAFFTFGTVALVITLVISLAAAYIGRKMLLILAAAFFLAGVVMAGKAVADMGATVLKNADRCNEICEWRADYCDALDGDGAHHIIACGLAENATPANTPPQGAVVHAVRDCDKLTRTFPGALGPKVGGVVYGPNTTPFYEYVPEAYGVGRSHCNVYSARTQTWIDACSEFSSVCKNPRVQHTDKPAVCVPRPMPSGTSDEDIKKRAEESAGCSGDSIVKNVTVPRDTATLVGMTLGAFALLLFSFFVAPMVDKRRRVDVFAENGGLLSLVEAFRRKQGDIPSWDELTEEARDMLSAEIRKVKGTDFTERQIGDFYNGIRRGLHSASEQPREE